MCLSESDFEGHLSLLGVDWGKIKQFFSWFSRIEKINIDSERELKSKIAMVEIKKYFKMESDSYQGYIDLVIRFQNERLV